MTAPRYLPCRCGHARNDHYVGPDTDCRERGCECVRYQPDVPRSTAADASRPLSVAEALERLDAATEDYRTALDREEAVS